MIELYNPFNLVGLYRKIKAYFYPIPCNGPFDRGNEFHYIDEKTGFIRDKDGKEVKESDDEQE